MKVLITGRGGQLAWELEQSRPNNIALTCLNSKQLDISNQKQVEQVFAQLTPDLVINAAAYTAVDKAETDSETAYAVNDLGSEYLAKACKAIKAKLIHISTDFVFDGSQNTPYQINQQTNPINVYGASKLAGENKINAILGAQAMIIRTAWVYSKQGNNFVKTMLRLMAEKDSLGVVYDQVGTPTWAKGLANLIWTLSTQDNIATEKANKADNSSTILHWTDAGVCSWYDFAVAIQDIGLEKGMLEKAIPIRPIAASSYPTPAKRPSFSVIDKSSTEKLSGLNTVHWRKQLAQMMAELNN
ncbi:dTDP-4-dehydrorhamnose reductase [Colwelliaceae bacterium MEBiC 14330]